MKCHSCNGKFNELIRHLNKNQSYQVDYDMEMMQNSLRQAILSKWRENSKIRYKSKKLDILSDRKRYYNANKAVHNLKSEKYYEDNKV